MATPRTPDSVRMIQVIEVQAVRGSGTNEDDPCRIVTQYWSAEGLLLAENDPHLTRLPEYRWLSPERT